MRAKLIFALAFVLSLIAVRAEAQVTAYQIPPYTTVPGQQPSAGVLTHEPDPLGLRN